MAPADHHVTLITRAGCHLCEEAERCCAGWPASSASATRSSTSTPTRARRAEYSDRVPVILIDGQEHGYWRVEEQRSALRDRPRWRQRQLDRPAGL